MTPQEIQNILDHNWSDSELRLSDSELRRLIEFASGRTVLANLHTDTRLIEWAVKNGSYISINHPSKYENPFEIGIDGDYLEVCVMYYDYVQNQPWFGDVATDLKGKVLGCTCYPGPCHGQILVEIANGVAPALKPAQGALASVKEHQFSILSENTSSDICVMQIAAASEVIEVLVRCGYLVKLPNKKGAVLSKKGEQELKAWIQTIAHS